MQPPLAERALLNLWKETQANLHHCGVRPGRAAGFDGGLARRRSCAIPEPLWPLAVEAAWQKTKSGSSCDDRAAGAAFADAGLPASGMLSPMGMNEVSKPAPPRN